MSKNDEGVKTPKVFINSPPWWQFWKWYRLRKKRCKPINKVPFLNLNDCDTKFTATSYEIKLPYGLNVNDNEYYRRIQESSRRISEYLLAKEEEEILRDLDKVSPVATERLYQILVKIRKENNKDG